MSDAYEKAVQDLSRTVSDKQIVFVEILCEIHGDDFPWAYFLEKPWKWIPEYTTWIEHGKPRKGGQGWEAFVAAMEAA